MSVNETPHMRNDTHANDFNAHVGDALSQYENTNEPPRDSGYSHHGAEKTHSPEEIEKRLSLWLASLNNAQRDAVLLRDGPLLVLAGAGTGKTRVIVTKVAALINSGVERHRILCVTFTNRAAREMKDRIADMVGGNVNSMWISTFHSLCLRMLREHPQEAGLKRGFTILDMDDKKRLLKLLLANENIADADTLKKISGQIESWQNQLITPEDILAQHRDNQEETIILEAKIYNAYVSAMIDSNAIDFGHMILSAVKMLQAEDSIRQLYRKRFNYILVDEYQDINLAQYRWLSEIVGEHNNICVVGDEDQSIYGWRGADISYILRFTEDFPQAKTVSLVDNYRSTNTILSAANSLIANNTERYGKKLNSIVGHGDVVRIVECEDAFDESNFLCHMVNRLLRSGARTTTQDPIQGKDTAILVRNWRITRVIEETLMRYKIPYLLVGGMRFYDRAEVRDILAYIRIIVNPDDNAALLRIINIPGRGIGTATINKLQRTASDQDVSIVKIFMSMHPDTQKTQSQAKLLTFRELLHILLNSANLTPEHMIKKILKITDYEAHLVKKDQATAKSRIENIHELVSAARGFESAQEFLDHVGLFQSADGIIETPHADNDCIRVMTIHGAKGTEFHSVFLPAWEQGEFPSVGINLTQSSHELQEERRLAYVALTRAKQHLYISWAKRRQTFGSWRETKPSMFVYELPHEAVMTLSPSSALNSPFTIDGNAFKNQSSGFVGNFHKTQQYDHSHPSNQSTTKPNRYPTNQSTEVSTLPQRQEYAVGGITAEKKGDSDLSVGDIVNNVKFGKGTIIGIEGMVARVDFYKSGIKRILSRFLYPQ